jgi:hypothetical protein
MPMQGTLFADFSDYIDETKKADAALASFQRTNEKTDASVNQTAAAMTKGADAASSTASGFSKMSDGLRVADKSLSAFGVNVGQEINVLSELGNVAGKTVSQVGALGTATAVLAVAVGSFKLGRFLSEWSGLDQVMGPAIEKFLGFAAALKAQETGAGLDTLALASQRAGRTITDFNEALRVNADWVRENTNKYTSSAAVLNKYRDAVSGLGPKQAELRAEIEAGVLSHDQLAHRYNISAAAVDYYAKRLDQQADADKKATEHTKKLSDATADLDAALGKSSIAYASLDAATRAKVESNITLGVSETNIATALGLTEAQVKSVSAAMKQAKTDTEALAAANKMVSDLATQFSQEQVNASATSTQKQILDIGTWRAAKMAALSEMKGATLEHYEAVARIADEKLAEVNKAHAASAAQVAKELDAQTAAAAKAYQDETDAMIASFNAQQNAWAKTKFGAEDATGSIKGATAATGQLTVAMQDFGTVASSAYERAIAGAQLFAAYANAGIPTSGSIGLAGYEFDQLKRTGVPGGLSGMQWANTQPIDTSASWGKQNTLNVNVNSSDATDIAGKLVSEMKRSGYRL